MGPSGITRTPASAAIAVRAVRDRHQSFRLSLRETAARLGHANLELHSTDPSGCGMRYVARCGCGWVSSSTATPEAALGAVCHHLQLVVSTWDRGGQPLPDLPAQLETEPAW
jgi:hypothetical protein